LTPDVEAGRCDVSPVRGRQVQVATVIVMTRWLVVPIGETDSFRSALSRQPSALAVQAVSPDDTMAMIGEAAQAA
jgi:hypothetical protein